MKKIVLYTIGALCLLGQNGIGSEGIRPKGDMLLSIKSVDLQPRSGEEEEIKITNQFAALTFQISNSSNSQEKIKLNQRVFCFEKAL